MSCIHLNTRQLLFYYQMSNSNKGFELWSVFINVILVLKFSLFFNETYIYKNVVFRVSLVEKLERIRVSKIIRVKNWV